jgi:thymidylate synthase (FAD)
MNLLNHGYIELVEHWGSDERIIEAARMSTQKGFQRWGDDSAPGDERLLSYLWRNHHDTPFEFAGAVFEVRAPIFVFREWHRHRTQSYNEASARYAPLKYEDYAPTTQRVMAASGKNKQFAGMGATITAQDAAEWVWSLIEAQALAEKVYQAGLELGVPKQLARLALTVARFSTMRCSANLRNWLSFISLRNSPFAQEEIRVYAEAMQEILTTKFPRTLALFSSENPR